MGATADSRVERRVKAAARLDAAYRRQLHVAALAQIGENALIVQGQDFAFGIDCDIANAVGLCLNTLLTGGDVADRSNDRVAIAGNKAADAFVAADQLAVAVDDNLIVVPGTRNADDADINGRVAAQIGHRQVSDRADVDAGAFVGTGADRRIGGRQNAGVANGQGSAFGVQHDRIAAGGRDVRVGLDENVAVGARLSRDAMAVAAGLDRKGPGLDIDVDRAVIDETDA